MTQAKVRNTQITIDRINSIAKLESAIESGLVETFQECFSEPPYNQLHQNEQVGDYFREYFEQGKILVAKNKDRVIGFAVSLPIEKASIYQADLISPEGSIVKFELLASKSQIPIGNIQYLADLGVSKAWRNVGIGAKLFSKIESSFTAQTCWAVRVLAELDRAQRFYQKLGFDKQLASQNVKYKYLDGSDRENKRAILIKAQS